MRSINDPEKPKVIGETLACEHFYRDVTMPRCVIFRDAITHLFIVELSDRMTIYQGYRARYERDRLRKDDNRRGVLRVLHAGRHGFILWS